MDERIAAGPLWTSEWPSLVFTTAVGTPLHQSNARRALAKLTEVAGLGRWHPHRAPPLGGKHPERFRCSPEHVADVLGHDGVRMTALVYRHAISPSVTAAAGPMQEVLGPRNRRR